MHSPLHNEFAPVTFQFGFIEASFPTLCDAFTRWHEELDEKSSLRTEFKSFVAPLASALSTIEPLTTPLDRYLLVETRSSWTAIFANGLRGNDVGSPVSYLPSVLKCRGLEVGHAPDLSHSNRKNGIRSWGHTLFALYGPDKTDWLNRIRYLSVWNDVGGWEFSSEGEIQSYEEPEQYGARKIKDRFSPDMLERYCKALGIELSDCKFYGPRSCAIRITGRKVAGRLSMSIAEARSTLEL
jgi:hypothetical protein